MQGIKFNDIHSYRDLNLILAPFQMPPATPKTNFFDVPGADGSIDASESLGEIKFNDRTGSIVFSVLPGDDFEEKKTEVSNLLNGLKCKITLDKDPNFYYLGRLSVKDYKANKMLRQITIDFRVQPYKYKLNKTRVIVPFATKNLIDMSKYTLVVGEADSIKFENNKMYVKYTSWNGLTVRFRPIPVNPQNTYMFSYDVVGGDRIVISFFDAEGNNISQTASTTGAYLEAYSGRYTMVWDGIKIKMSSDVASIQIGLCGMNAVAEDEYNEYSNLQLEVGEAVTEYEAYTPITTNEVVLINNRMSVVPTITTTEETTITFGDAILEMNAGTHKFLDIYLKQGENPITVESEGIVTITYQEGAL